MRERRSDTALRIAGFYAASLAVATLLLGTATYGFASQVLARELEQRMRIEMATLLRADHEEGRAALAADVAARDAAPGVNGGYLLTSSDKRRIAGDLGGPTPPQGWSTISFKEDNGSIDSGRAYSVRLPDGAALTVVEESSSLARVQRALLTIYAAGFGLMLALSAGGGALLGSTILGRLGKLDEAARAIIDGDLNRRMPIGANNDEFDRLSATLNHMLDRIGQLLDNLRYVSDDIAHDLRTPLSRLRARLELALEPTDAPARDRLVQEAIERADGLLSLFSTILRISEIEGGAVRQQYLPVALDRLVADVAEAYAPAAEDAGHVIGWSAEPVTILGDRELLAQATANLIDNALKHTPAGTRIHMAVMCDSTGSALLTIADDGPGIAPEEHADVLRRFGRGRHGRKTPGHGLGLNLVAAIAVVHGGSLALGGGSDGLSATMRLPAGRRGKG